MRILAVCPYSLDRPGGVQGQVTGLARALRARGNDVMVLAPGEGAVAKVTAPGAASRCWTAGTTEVVGRAVGVRANGSVAPVALSPAAAVRAVQWARVLRPDVVHLHEPLAPSTGYGLLLSRPAPLVGTYRLLGPLARWAHGRLAIACAVSESARTTTPGGGAGIDRVLFNGVDTEAFETADPWPTQRPTIVFVGRHEERKGLGVLLEAFTGMQAVADLWVVGDGPARAALERAYPESHRLHWLGRVSGAELARRLAGADILCAPSLRGESYGVVLVEAMAARCAVVASDLPGYREASDGHAVLVPPGSAEALGRALSQAVADAAAGTGACAPEALDRSSASARSRSMSRLAALYEALYREAAESGSGAAHPVA